MRNASQFLGNVVWLLFGGCAATITWVIIGLLCCCTLIFIPFGKQCFKVAYLELRPFGLAVSYTPRPEGGFLQLLGNILWMSTGGLSLACIHLALGVVLCLTLVGIPFGKQHFKLAQLAIFPFGAQVLPA